MFAKLRAWVFAVDPGEEYAGLAWTRAAASLVGGETVGSRYATATVSPDDGVDRFYLWAEAVKGFGVLDPVLVIEEYRMYPDKVQMHSGKTIPTSENIGAFKYVARVHGIRVVEQPAGIKRPMAGVMNGRAVKALGDTRHAKDAELHMWYFCLGKELPGLK
jgi:hypothetical protein